MTQNAYSQAPRADRERLFRAENLGRRKNERPAFAGRFRHLLLGAVETHPHDRKPAQIRADFGLENKGLAH